MLYMQKLKYVFQYSTLFIFHLIILSLISCEQADNWTRKADMPTPRMGLSTCVVNGKIYAIGGYPKANVEGLKTMEVYDPSTNT